MKKSLKITAGVLASGILAVSALGAADQEVKTWSHVMTGISAEFEAGHKGTGKWGTDPSRIITQSWVACQDGAGASRDIAYSPKMATTDFGRFKASKEHFNNPFVDTLKYYGWYY